MKTWASILQRQQPLHLLAANMRYRSKIPQLKLYSLCDGLRKGQLRNFSFIWEVVKMLSLKVDCSDFSPLNC